MPNLPLGEMDYEAAINQLAVFCARIYLVGTMSPASVEPGVYSPEELVQKADRLIRACLDGLPLLQPKGPRA